MLMQYSPKASYELGDRYKNAGKWLAAELCYELPLITHPKNKQFTGDIIPDKLHLFIQFRTGNNVEIPPKPVDIPPQASQLLASFYSIWLIKDIKPDLIQRSEIHANKRAEELINIFNDVTNKYDNIGKLDISHILKELIQNHRTKVSNWKGPSFNKLQYKKGAKKSPYLTVVMEFKAYRKRCRNSQEDWFQKYDDDFFAKCLTEIAQIFGSRLLSTQVADVKIEFAKIFLSCKIQFELSAARWLLPAGIIFNCTKLHEVLNQFHPRLDAKEIKQNSTSKKVKDLRPQLLQICMDEYNAMVNRNNNNNNNSNNNNNVMNESVAEISVVTEHAPIPIPMIFDYDDGHGEVDDDIDIDIDIDGDVNFMMDDNQTTNEWSNTLFISDDTRSLFTNNLQTQHVAQTQPMSQIQQQSQTYTVPHSQYVQYQTHQNPQIQLQLQPQQQYHSYSNIPYNSIHNINNQQPVRVPLRNNYVQRFQLNPFDSLQQTRRIHRNLPVRNDHRQRSVQHRQHMRHVQYQAIINQQRQQINSDASTISTTPSQQTYTAPINQVTSRPDNQYQIHQNSNIAIQPQPQPQIQSQPIANNNQNNNICLICEDWEYQCRCQ